ncbi:MAG: ATP-binding protein, partial [Syntrophobacteraceae bacterium]
YCLDDDVPPELVGDPVRLRQIISNLVGNAIKFTEQGEIFLLVTRDSGDEETVRLKFEIRDTGIGIPPDTMPHIFDAFSQADGSTTRKYGGTGLGLAISKQLCNAMGGDITVESEYGIGSSFLFTAVFAYRPTECEPESAIIDTAAKALIVDHNATLRWVFARQIEKWGLSCHGAKGMGEALTMINTELDRGEPYRIVFLAVNMPGLSGSDLKALKSHAALRKAELILLFSMSQDGLDGGRSTGAFTSLTKPVRYAELHQAILKVIGSAERRPVPAKPICAKRELKFEGRILLAEDNPINQEVGRAMIESLGCRVDVAANGREALKLLNSCRYAVVLMDCQMPEMD